MEGAELRFTREAILAIAEKALLMKTGARALRSIMEDIMLDIMYDLPSEKEVSKVIVDESVIKGASEPMRIYENQDHPKAAPE